MVLDMLAGWSAARINQFLERRRETAFQKVDRWERRVIEGWIHTIPHRAVLDAPCGNGRLFNSFPHTVEHLIGVDADFGFCAQARRLAETLGLESEIICGLLPDLGLPTVDVAVCVRFWCHLPGWVADRLLARLLMCATSIILQFNEDDGTDEAVALSVSPDCRLDTTRRIAEVASSMNAEIVRVARHQSSTSRFVLLRKG